MVQHTGDYTGVSRNKLVIQRQLSQTIRFRRSTLEIKLNKDEARQVQTSTLQAITHKIKLNEETKVRRVQVDTLQAIAHKIELNEEKEARRRQVGALQPIVHKIGPKEGKEARRKLVGTL